MDRKKDRYAYKISPDKNGNITIDYSQVEYEITDRKSSSVIEVYYLFKDHSSVKILYTKDRDYILERDYGWIND